MNRFLEGQIIIGSGIELTTNEVLRLEIEMVELGRLLETDFLQKTKKGYVVVYEKPILNSVVEFMESTSNALAQNPSTSSNTNAQSFPSHRQYNVGQPPRIPYFAYNDRNEGRLIKSKGKRLPLETLDSSLLIDDNYTNV